MLDLLSNYTIDETVIFAVMLLFAARECVGFMQWLTGYYNEKFNKDYAKKSKAETLEQHYVKCERQHEESMENYDILNKKIDQLSENLKKNIEEIKDNISTLMESDKDDIKSWLVEKYNFYKENKDRPISNHTMDTIEKRYSHYKEEGGNSFIDETIMPGLRMMSKEENRCV